MSTGTFTSGVKVEKDKQPGWLTKYTMLAYGVLTYGISWGIAIALVTAMQNGMLNPDGTLASVLVQIAAASPALAALVVIAATRGRARLARFCTPKITSQKWPFDGQHHPGCFLGPVALTKSCTVGQASILILFQFMAIMISTFIHTWTYNQTRGSVLIAMLLHASGNVTPDLVPFLVGTDDVAFRYQTNTAGLIGTGVLMMVILLFTRGRLGYKPDRSA